MDTRQFHRIAHLLADGTDRRRLAGTVLATVTGGLGLPGTGLAGCKQVGKKCDKNKDCCDHAECKGGECKCKSGHDECGGKCYKLDTDEKHCGACHQDCGGGEKCCEGTCRDVERDEANCGSCGAACPPGQICSNGQCALI